MVARARVLALDFGMSRIGVAVSDELGLLAHPRPFVVARPPAKALRLIAKLAHDEGVVRILVGLPLQLDSKESLSSRRAREFAKQVGVATGLEVELVDERLSTVQAQAQLHASGRSTKESRRLIDSQSACVVLQSWLDGHRDRSSGGT